MEYNKKLLNILTILAFCINACIGESKAITIPDKEKIYTESELPGKWQMQTIVTMSNCPFIPIGITTKSKLIIKPIFSGKEIHLRAFWKGGNWKKSKGTLRMLSEKEAITERVTEFKIDKNNSWKALLIDHLKISDNGKLTSESIVIQYKNGKSIGEYTMYSILTKLE